MGRLKGSGARHCAMPPTDGRRRWADSRPACGRTWAGGVSAEAIQNRGAPRSIEHPRSIELDKVLGLYIVPRSGRVKKNSAEPRGVVDALEQGGAGWFKRMVSW